MVVMLFEHEKPNIEKKNIHAEYENSHLKSTAMNRPMNLQQPEVPRSESQKLTAQQWTKKTNLHSTRLFDK